MNIKISNLNESKNYKFNLTEDDLINYLNENFPDNPKSWKEATCEPMDMSNWIYDVVSDVNGQEKASVLKDTSKSKTPKEWNKKHKKRVIVGFKMLDEYNKKMFFEQFGHWVDAWKSKIKNLNESEEQKIKIEDEKEIEDVLKYKKNQFTFDSGVFMGTIKSGLETKFGLLWHAKNTENLGGFINSVQTFLDATKETLTSADIERLSNHYVKYYFDE